VSEDATPPSRLWPRLRGAVTCLLLGLCLGPLAWRWFDPQANLCWQVRKGAMLASQPDMEPRVPLDPWGRPLVGEALQIPAPMQRGGRYYTSALSLWSVGPNGVDEGGAGDDLVVPPREQWPGRVVAYAVWLACSQLIFFAVLLLYALPEVRRIPPRPLAVEVSFATLIAALVGGGLWFATTELAWLLDPWLSDRLLVSPAVAKGLTLGGFTVGVGALVFLGRQRIPLPGAEAVAQLRAEQEGSL